MGFSTLIDILGSIMIGGILLMILLRLNDSAVQNSFQYNCEAITQRNLVEIVQLLEHDFRKIGFCKDWNNFPDPTKAIIAADSTTITFLCDVDSDKDMDTLRYILGSSDELLQTPNPNDKMLYRQVNNEPLGGANLGVTQFKLTYFDSFGVEIPFPILTPSEIYTMQIDLVVEDVVAYNQEYNRVFWRQIRLAARNLGNR
ncbi:MAG: hypothetical protein KKF62_00315 [Bacteroidetes bacterium]|nr:hypothetical protein [Bacteroidota bacterium]MBU1115633.1 hypothetical protein [Bacteroidota bacterium]MBU1798998.1 hypothetical protein [Bacteroidota bacterium]